MKPYIHQSFWSDTDIENQPPEIKLSAIWFITNKQTSILGVCQTSKRQFSFQTGLSEEWFDKALEALNKGFIRVGDSFVIKNFIHYQFGSGESLTKNNFFRTMVADFMKASDEIQAVILEYYPEFSEVPQRASKGVVNPKESKERKGSERKERAEGFDEFYEAYPKKESKADAVKAWEKLKPDEVLREIIHNKLSIQKQSDSWRRDGGQFIPLPATWLNKRKWEDVGTQNLISTPKHSTTMSEWESDCALLLQECKYGILMAKKAESKLTRLWQAIPAQHRNSVKSQVDSEIWEYLQTL